MQSNCSSHDRSPSVNATRPPVVMPGFAGFSPNRGRSSLAVFTSLPSPPPPAPPGGVARVAGGDDGCFRRSHENMEPSLLTQTCPCRGPGRLKPALVHRHPVRLERVELHELRFTLVLHVVAVAGGLFALVGELVDFLGGEDAALLEDVGAGVGDAGAGLGFFGGLGVLVLAAVEVVDLLADS